MAFKVVMMTGKRAIALHSATTVHERLLLYGTVRFKKSKGAMKTMNILKTPERSRMSVTDWFLVGLVAVITVGMFL